MKFEFYLAKKSLFQKHKSKYVSFIRLFAIIGLVIGVVALLVTIGILNGFEKNMVAKITGFDGHIRFESVSSSDIEVSVSLREKIMTNNLVVYSAPYINSEAMIRNNDETEGVLLECMLEQDFRKIMFPSKELVSGELKFDIADSEIPGIYLGKGIAQNISVEVDDTVKILVMNGTPSMFNPLEIHLAIVTGIFTTGMSEYDKSISYTSLKAGQNIFNMKSKITGYNILLKDASFADEMSDWIENNFSYPYYSSTWKERNSILFKWLDTQKVPLMLVFGLIGLVAIVNIISTLLMLILVKEKDIAILKSMGMKPAKIKKVVIAEGLIISIVGISLGVVIAKILELIQNKWGIIKVSADVYFTNEVPIDISLMSILIVIILGLTLSIIVSYIPARKASKIKPVEILRYE